MNKSLLLALPVLASAFLADRASAQLQVFGGDAERMSSTRIFWDNGPAGMICVQYGQPTWKAEYDGMVDSAKGKKLRLGKDFWTTFNTSVALQLGDSNVAAGSYYLGLECDDKGAFHLLLLNAEKSDKAGYTPFMPDQWKADYSVALTHDADADETVQKLQITFVGEDPNAMTLKLAWGTHSMTASMKAKVGGSKAKDASHGKDQDGEEVVEEHAKKETVRRR